MRLLSREWEPGRAAKIVVRDKYITSGPGQPTTSFSLALTAAMGPSYHKRWASKESRQGTWRMAERTRQGLSDANQQAFAERDAESHSDRTNQRKTHRARMASQLSLRSSGTLQKLTEVMNVGGAGIADDEIPETPFCPCLATEGQLLAEEGPRVQPAELGAILEDKDRNPMFSDLKQELRAGALPQVRKASTDELEWRVLQFRQVEAKRKLPLKPRLNGMSIGRHNINGICAGQGGNM